MAESAVKLVVGKLEALLAREADFLLGVDDQIKFLRVQLLWIQSFLRDAEEKRRGNERIKVWVALMREIAYDAEDVIDRYFLRIELQQQRRSFYTRPIGWVKEIPTLHVLGKKMENINARFQKIVDCKSHFGIESIVTGDTSSSSRPSEARIQRSSYPREVHTVGLDDHVKSLTTKLTDGNVARRAVISIVGMGGLGKTTLASRVYNSEDVTNHFQCKAWISISQNFREKDLLQDIVEGFMGKRKQETDGMSKQQLESEVSKWLEGKIYLLVVDDIWSKEAWDCIRYALPDTRRGSRVMITTRIIDVAKYADPGSDPYDMKTLDNDRSWELFCARAFSNANCPSNLEKIGKEIVSSCDGLPLAIVVMGGLLRRKKQSTIEWEKVHDRVYIEFREGENHVQRILALSYDDLPHQLKACFLYLAIFPADSMIDADRLIRLWIAEGFIQQKQELSMEQVAEDYLEDLINRSMIQLKSRNKYGGAKIIGIHDLLLDFALSEAKEINFLDVYEKRGYFDPSSSLRRLAILNHIEEYTSLKLSTPKLRSLVYTGPSSKFNHPNFYELILILVKMAVGFLACQHQLYTSAKGSVRTLIAHKAILSNDSKLLRVIDLKGAVLTSLPKEIGDMVQLRYLGLANTTLVRLPSSVGDLCNLQTFDVRGTTISSLPKAFWRIKTLRHVFLEKRFFQGKPDVVDRWNDLQTLKIVRCGNWVRSGLARMRNLRHLSMIGISHADVDILATAFEGLDSFVSLKLEGESLPVEVFTFSTHQHLQKLKLSGLLGGRLPHDKPQLMPNLRRLELYETGLEKDDITILAKLPELCFLRLGEQSYKNAELVFPAQGFPKLEELVLFGLLELEMLKVDNGSLVSLREFKMNRCKNLKMLPEGMQCMTSLYKLEVCHMPVIARRIHGEDYFRIQHVRMIVVEPLPMHRPVPL